MLGPATALLIASLVFPAPAAPAQATAPDAQAAPFLGAWDLTLHTPALDYASWLDITDNNGQLQGRMVGRWGHAHPVVNLQVQNGVLTFASPKEEESLPHDMPYRATVVDGHLTGTTAGPNNAPWTWTGKRAPTLDRTAAPHWGHPIRLFNGKNTQGWRFDKPDSSGNWSVPDGVLTTTRRGSDLITDRKFKDFKIHIEFNCAANCNSGVYLRGRYEVQVAEATDRVPPDRRAAAIYGFLAPSPAVTFSPGTWQTYDITLIGRTVTVAWNGHTVIDHQIIPGPTGGALDSNEASPGPIYLQGTEDAGATSFRNIVLTPAKE